MRIPAHLSSDKVVQTLKEKLTESGPETFGALLEFECLDSGDGFDAPDLPAELKTPLNDASDEVFGNKPVYVGCGGSIPIAGHFQKITGVTPMLIGFGKDDDQLHSPNEKYDLESFHKGMRSWARVLAELAD